MQISASRQRNSVSQGFALGLLLNGYRSIGGNKLSIDMAFNSAWRRWPHRSLFPTVDSNVRRHMDGYSVIVHATEARHTFALFWEPSGDGYVIVARQDDWSADDPDDVDFALRVIDGGLTADAWKRLASGTAEGMLSTKRAT